MSFRLFFLLYDRRPFCGVFHVRACFVPIMARSRSHITQKISYFWKQNTFSRIFALRRVANLTFLYFAHGKCEAVILHASSGALAFMIRLKTFSVAVAKSSILENVR